LTYADLSFQLGARVDYIDRHRPILLQVQYALFAVGLFFYTIGRVYPGVFQETTWGALAHEMPAAFWGAVNALAAMITILGLLKPVNSAMVATGASLQVLQFGAIAMSCIFYGGDYGIGIYSMCLVMLHCKVLYESVRR
jgi:hypothetical protein